MGLGPEVKAQYLERKKKAICCGQHLWMCFLALDGAFPQLHLSSGVCMFDCLVFHGPHQCHLSIHPLTWDILIYLQLVLLARKQAYLKKCF